MARPLTPDQILAAFDKWGVTYREWPGWKTRGRPGAFDDVNGVMIHHTGSDTQSESYVRWLFEEGRPAEGIPAPLAQFMVGMDGVCYIGAAGRANHGGRGSSSTLTKVIAEEYAGFSTEIKPGPDNTDGNAHFYGFEVMFDGGQPMTGPQYDTTVRATAALLDAHGWTALSAIAHREWSARKWDPGETPMDEFRRDVRDRLAAGPGNDDPPKKEPKMPSEKQIWGHRERFMTWIRDVYPDLRKDGWRPIAMLQDVFARLRLVYGRLTRWDWLVNTLGRAVWSRRAGGDGPMHATRLRNAERNSERAMRLAEENNKLLRDLARAQKITVARTAVAPLAALAGEGEDDSEPAVEATEGAE